MEAIRYRFNKMKLTNKNSSILRKLDVSLVRTMMQILSTQNSKLKTAKDKSNPVSSRHASHTHCPNECRDEIQSPFRENVSLKSQLNVAFSPLLTTWTFTWIERI